MLAILAMTLGTVTPPKAAPIEAVPASTSVAGNPAVRVKLSDNVYLRGDRARVHVKSAKDGYLLVLRADADGRVRVLFPLDPTTAGQIRAGKELEIRGRGDREAFMVDDPTGSGTVIAAVSTTPFKADSYARGGHWDYTALANVKVGNDPEASLLELVDRMTDSHCDYDVASYTVAEREYVNNYYRPGWYHPYLGYYSPYYDPWFYGPGFGFGFRSVIVLGRHGRW